MANVVVVRVSRKGSANPDHIMGDANKRLKTNPDIDTSQTKHNICLVAPTTLDYIDASGKRWFGFEAASVKNAEDQGANIKTLAKVSILVGEIVCDIGCDYELTESRRVSRGHPPDNELPLDKLKTLKEARQISKKKFFERNIDEVPIHKDVVISPIMAEKAFFARMQKAESMRLERIKAFYQHALEGIEKKVGAKNIVAAYVHLDEGNPHLHVVYSPVLEVPIRKNEVNPETGKTKKVPTGEKELRINMSQLWKGKVFKRGGAMVSDSFSKFQDLMFDHLSEKYKVARGIRSDFTNAEHVATNKYKAAEYARNAANAEKNLVAAEKMTAEIVQAAEQNATKILEDAEAKKTALIESAGNEASNEAAKIIESAHQKSAAIIEFAVEDAECEFYETQDRLAREAILAEIEAEEKWIEPNCTPAEIAEIEADFRLRTTEILAEIRNDELISIEGLITKAHTKLDNFTHPVNGAMALAFKEVAEYKIRAQKDLDGLTHPENGAIAQAKAELNTYTDPENGLIAQNRKVAQDAYYADVQAQKDSLAALRKESNDLALKIALDTAAAYDPETGSIPAAQAKLAQINQSIEIRDNILKKGGSLDEARGRLFDAKNEYKKYTDPKHGLIVQKINEYAELSKKYSGGIISVDAVFTGIKYAWEKRKVSASDMLNVLHTMYESGFYAEPRLLEMSKMYLGIDMKTKNFVDNGQNLSDTL